ncbi:hypothetical protein BC938DRAFT_477456 [Jimgerdemannia flammicorona]|uniref:Uncharacterized protein n=1 Tax=Jimgerdemannia flammicorona TaxID=994334 RepID=A0A433QP97_9FUNG|nr:hypothetical protein BC938DRAFT_477456 [Jimgerdemannia flammicorona]
MHIPSAPTLVAGTFNLTHIKRHYYMSHRQVNPTQVVPYGNGPDLAHPVIKGIYDIGLFIVTVFERDKRTRSILSVWMSAKRRERFSSTFPLPAIETLNQTPELNDLAIAADVRDTLPAQKYTQHSCYVANPTGYSAFIKSSIPLPRAAGGIGAAQEPLCFPASCL